MSPPVIARKVSTFGIYFKAGREGVFRAKIATLAPAVDKDGDVTLAGAFPVGKQIVISAYGHASWKGALPVGKGTIGANGHAAWVDGEFFIDTSDGRDTYNTVKRLGALGQWSYGYEVLDASFDVKELARYPTACRVLKSLDVYEASPVLLGAGVDTTTEYVKGRWFSDRPLTDRELAAMRQDLESKMLAGEIALALAKAERILNPPVLYSEVDEDKVHPTLSKTAREVLAWVTRDLALKSTPRLRWFTPEGAGHELYRRKYRMADWPFFEASRPIWGKATAAVNEIWVRDDISPADIVETVAHECRHVKQGVTTEGEKEVAEADALAYGRQTRARLIGA